MVLITDLRPLRNQVDGVPSGGASKEGGSEAALLRVRAGISYALTETMDEGHCGLPTEELLSVAESLFEVPSELVATALKLELAEGTVIADRVGETPCTS
jgi:exodeoxyribonuclease V alpha subunit